MYWSSDVCSSDLQPPIGELQPTLSLLRAAHRSKVPDYAQRRDDLARLRGLFKARLDDMVIAIAADFGHRSRHETLVSDGMTVLAEIDVMRRDRKSTRLNSSH